MSNQLKTFDFEGANVQAITDEKGELWFLAKDVAEILEYSDAFEMTKKLESYEIQNLQLAGFGNRGVNFISESGLYSSITGSRKPEAKKFKKWVNSEVLPSIRKTGSYSVQPAPNLNDPALLRTLLLDNVNKVIELQETVAQQAPKVAALTRLSESEGSLNITEAAKALGIPQKKMFDKLKMEKWIYKRAGSKNWLGYHDKDQRGYLTHKVTPILMPDGTERISEQVRITPKGLTKLAQIFSEGGAITTGGTAHA